MHIARRTGSVPLLGEGAGRERRGFGRDGARRAKPAARQDEPASGTALGDFDGAVRQRNRPQVFRRKGPLGRFRFGVLHGESSAQHAAGDKDQRIIGPGGAWSLDGFAAWFWPHARLPAGGSGECPWRVYFINRKGEKFLRTFLLADLISRKMGAVPFLEAPSRSPRAARSSFTTARLS